MNKKGVSRAQTKISFGMIFSITLIVIFLVFAFYAIRIFLGIGKTATVEKFASDLQSDIDTVWKSTESSRTEEYSIPTDINYVCFVDFNVSAKGEMKNIYTDLEKNYYSNENMIFYPIDSSSASFAIKNIDLAQITESENPFCVEISGGKLELILKKDFNEALVTITK